MVNRIKPPEFDKKLAEEIGIHIGDGSLGIYKKTNHYDYTVCGGPDDANYLLNFVKPLMNRIYGLNRPCTAWKKKNTLTLTYCSKELISWKREFGLPVGPKDGIEIPQSIVESDFILDCLRGIFDTDGSMMFKKRNGGVNYYPVIKLACKSRPLISQISEILKSIGIQPNIQYDVVRNDKRGFVSVINQLHMNGKKNLDIFMNKIGFSNPKHMTKYIIWKKNGFVEPRTTLKERLKIIDAGGGI